MIQQVENPAKGKNPEIGLPKGSAYEADLPKHAAYQEPQRAELRHKVIGEFIQSKVQGMYDKDRQKFNVAAGKYPVFGNVDEHGLIPRGVIVFIDAVDPISKTQKNLLERRESIELAKMAQSGKIELAEGVTIAMLQPKVEQKQEQKHGLRR